MEPRVGEAPVSKEREIFALALLHERRKAFELDGRDFLREKANRVTASRFEGAQHVE